MNWKPFMNNVYYVHIYNLDFNAQVFLGLGKKCITLTQFTHFLVILLQLRLLYECAPMAFIIEQAGGMASDGIQPVLDVKAKTLHERCPIFIGSTEDVKDLLKFNKST